MNNEFVFERDTGIMFQRARIPEQPLKPKNNQFTVIPRLESVNAEEYNRQFEELIQSMPKNLAYSSKFGTESIIPPGVSSRSSRHQPARRPAETAVSAETPKPSEIEAPLREAGKPAEKTAEPENKPVPRPEPRRTEPAPVKAKPAPKKPEPQKPEPPAKEEEPIVFYTGYEQQSASDPFNAESSDKEIIIQGGKKKQTGSFKERFVSTFHKLFSTPAEDEFPDDSFE